MTYKEKIIECQIVNQGSAYSQQQLCIKTISIHDYSQLQDLKQNLLEIHDYITAEAASKVVNELFDCAAGRVNLMYPSYHIIKFRTGFNNAIMHKDK